MKTNKLHNSLENYLSAFKTIKRYNSNKLTTNIVAILQALSFLFIIPPLIALIGKKITESKGSPTENKSSTAAMKTLPVVPVKKTIPPEQQATLDEIERLNAEYVAEKQKIENLRKEISLANETWKKTSAEVDAFSLTKNETEHALRKAHKNGDAKDKINALSEKAKQLSTQASAMLEKKVNAAQDLEMNHEREAKLKRSLNDTETYLNNLIKLWEKLKTQGGEGADGEIAKLVAEKPQ